MLPSTQLVDPGAIQETLNKIWESLETTNTTRASLFNLIFYTKKNERAGYVQKLSQAVIERFPSRVILITVDDQATEDSLTTHVSILTSSKGEYDVACDLIQINATASSQEKIPFILLPHILPDLPVYLLYAEDPAQEDLLAAALAQFAQRWIFDSESTTNLAHFAKGILQYYQTLNTDIADLNWARIETWREMLSAAFYSKERVQQLQTARSLRISYNAHSSTYFSHTHIQAFYLQAWLACQLKWNFQKLHSDPQTKELSLIYEHNKTSIEVVIHPIADATLPPGLILDMDLIALDQTHFSFRRDHRQIHQMSLHVETPTQCLLPSKYIFSKSESGHSLVKEICHRGTSQHFLKTLELIQFMDLPQ